MTDSSLSSVSFEVADSDDRQSVTQNSIRLLMSRAALLMALGTFFLMALGSATRVMNAGLSCPDWPLCYGQWLPWEQMNLRVFLEWFHRLVASAMGLATIGLLIASWIYRRRLPTWTPIVAAGALGLVIFQGVLGGLTVTEMLRFDIVTAHLGTGLAFFSTLLSMGVLLLPYRGRGTAGWLPWLGLATTITIYSQSLLGGLVASQWALHQCLDYESLCSVMNSHIIGVFPASFMTLFLVGAVLFTRNLSVSLRSLGALSGVLLGSQVLVGIATFRLHLQVEPLTVAHQGIGAALLGSTLALTLLSFRDNRAERGDGDGRLRQHPLENSERYPSPAAAEVS